MDIFKERRSIRKFKSNPVPKEIIDYTIDCARLAPTGGNMQPIKYFVITKKAKDVFPYTKWAAYLPEFNPSLNDAPPCYIAICADLDIKKEGYELDAGICGSVITYSAESKGVSSCWLGAIDRQKISQIIKLPENMKLLYLIALGYEAQKSTAYDSNDTVKYEIDENENIKVPKKTFDSIVMYD